MRFVFHMRHLSVLFLAATILVAPMAFALEVAGVKMEETARVANQDLKLNGAGIRFKAIFKVYVAGLYLTEKKAGVTDVLAAPGARRIAIVMLRDVSSEEFGRAFLAGIHQNTDKTEQAKMIGQLVKFGEIFASVPELKKGDVLNADWLPGVGTVLQVNGKRIAEPLPDLAFYNALLKIWLGDKPADAKLKRAMLGEKSEETMRN